MQREVVERVKAEVMTLEHRDELWVLASDYAELLDRTEKAEAEVAQLTKAHDTVCGVAAVAGEVALARPSALETDDDWPDIPDTPEERAFRKGWNEAMADRNKSPETMAWAVVGEDGKPRVSPISGSWDWVYSWRDPGQRVVRVAIRVVEDGE